MRKPKIGRPPLPPGERRVTMTVRVRPATKAEAARRAKANGTSQGEETDRAFGA